MTATDELGGYCRDCGVAIAGGRDSPAACPACGSERILRHGEIDDLAIAHLDCDAFYAAIEKRDDPGLAEMPLIIGGGKRGVVATCCYIARRFGVRSAMPMFQARRLCPDAAIRRPDMRKYAAASAEIRVLMRTVTPLVEPISIDEAFLDLTGTSALHGCGPAQSLIRLARRIETEIGVTASIGLSYNKLLAKIASDLDKPRGFAVLGRAEARGFLAGANTRLLPGIGPAFERRLAADGITRILALQEMSEAALVGRYGKIGHRLFRFSRGEDDRAVSERAPRKSVSAETTFETDLADPAALARRLRPLCEKVATRLKSTGEAGRTVTLKLKTADFILLTRQRQLADPTQLADMLDRTARALLTREATGVAYRLIGVGVSELAPAAGADPADLFSPMPGAPARVERAIDTVRVERAIDTVRARFGEDSIAKGEIRTERPAATNGSRRKTK